MEEMYVEETGESYATSNNRKEAETYVHLNE